MDKKDVLLLTNNKNTLGLYQWLNERCRTEMYSGRITLEQIQKINPVLVVSYNYSYIISQPVIDFMEGNIINLHISLLPWNRGASPNLWSFLDETPKGVTIHQISSRLDRGCIICQQECEFDEQKETFESSYRKLNDMIVKLFQQNWENIKNRNYILKEQQGEGSYHTKKDLDMLMQKCPFEWSDCIADYKKRLGAVTAGEQYGE